MIDTLKNIVQTLPKKTLLLGILVIILTILILFSLLFSAVKPNNPVPGPVLTFSPSPNSSFSSPKGAEPITSFQQSLIGKTTDQQVATMSGIIDKKGGDNDLVVYSLQSFIPQRNNQITTQGGKAIFERALTPINPNGPGFVKISDFQQKYGLPIQEIKGSHFYGSFFVTYIYSLGGFAFIGNPNTDTIYEFQIFSPVSPENYLRLYGQDISADANIYREGF